MQCVHGWLIIISQLLLEPSQAKLVCNTPENIFVLLYNNRACELKRVEKQNRILAEKESKKARNRERHAQRRIET